MKIQDQNRKLIFRADAETNTLLTLVSFAASITLTRAFLYLTGYPQIGNNELHISHLLWGGLIMFAALLILQLYSNRWIQTVAAIMSGIGIGLFIDEIGKFITQENNYFYPAAAPIIYSFFLLTLLLLMIIKKRHKPDPRKNMYEVLEQLDDFLDHTLSDREADKLVKKLEMMTKTDVDLGIKRLAVSLLDVIESENHVSKAPKQSLFEQVESFFKEVIPNVLPRKKMRILLAAAWIAWGIWSLLSPIKVILNRQNEVALLWAIQEMVDANLINEAAGHSLFLVRIGLSILLGILIIISAFILLIKKDRIAAFLAFWTFLISLTISNLLLFYFDQFSTIFNAVIQFLLFITLVAYQRKYLASDSATI